MKITIGAVFFVIGTLSAVVGFAFNSSTPVQVGPIPTIGGAALALIGLVLFLSAL